MFQKAVEQKLIPGFQVATTERIRVISIDSIPNDQLELMIKGILKNLHCNSFAQFSKLHHSNYDEITQQFLRDQAAEDRFTYCVFGFNEPIGLVSYELYKGKHDVISISYLFNNLHGADKFCMEAILVLLKHCHINGKISKFVNELPIGSYICEKIIKELDFRLECIKLSDSLQLKVYSTSEFEELNNFQCSIS